MSVLGVDSYKTNPLTCTVLVQYDPKELTRDQIIEILDGALAAAEHPPTQGQARSSSAAVHALDAVGRGGPVRRSRRSCPWPRASSPTRRSPPSRTPARCSSRRSGWGSTSSTRSWWSAAWGRCRSSRAPCSAGAWASAACWSRRRRTTPRSCCLNAFGKQPRFVWLYRDGVEVQVVARPAPGRRHHRRQHRRGRAGRRRHRRGAGDDRPARPDRRVDAGREGGGRPGLRLDA